jgi:NAD(P)-dependent dehydrogenase (short-subunit alcohol dehydrogenase family)
VEAGEQLAANLPAASYIPADVRDLTEAARLVETTVERHGRLDILVNNTGVTEAFTDRDRGDVTTDAWGQVLGATVVGAWNVTRAAAPHLRARGEGVIINISSTAATTPAGSSIPYAVCEAALKHLTSLLANALAPEIRVRAAVPVGDPDARRLIAVADSGTADEARVMTPLNRHAARDIEEFLGDPPSSVALGSIERYRSRRRRGGTGRRRKNDPRFGWESLTAAELRVAEAVGTGLTNAQTAQRLFVSPYTVDYHLRQIFLKLGISSRVQLAAFMTQRPLAFSTLSADSRSGDTGSNPVGGATHRPR